MQLGDLVQLKAGGPKMVVGHISQPDNFMVFSSEVNCSWFDGNKRCKDDFAPEVLKLYEEPGTQSVRVTFVGGKAEQNLIDLIRGNIEVIEPANLRDVIRRILTEIDTPRDSA